VEAGGEKGAGAEVRILVAFYVKNDGAKHWPPIARRYAAFLDAFTGNAEGEA
jgi:hypothetical protein